MPLEKVFNFLAVSTSLLFVLAQLDKKTSPELRNDDSFCGFIQVIVLQESSKISACGVYRSSGALATLGDKLTFYHFTSLPKLFAL